MSTRLERKKRQRLVYEHEDYLKALVIEFGSDVGTVLDDPELNGEEKLTKLSDLFSSLKKESADSLDILIKELNKKNPALYIKYRT